MRSLFFVHASLQQRERAKKSPEKRAKLLKLLGIHLDERERGRERNFFLFFSSTNKTMNLHIPLSEIFEVRMLFLVLVLSHSKRRGISPEEG